MNFFTLIDKKKKGFELNYDEFIYFVNGMLSGEIPDYQCSALLMAIYINGMTDDELYAMVEAMLATSDVINATPVNTSHLIVDKHSSGGIGDTVSLILSPILAAVGYDVVKLSGRGLYFTGGTIDKLESIGVYYEYDKDNFQDYLNKTNFVIMNQSSNIVPSDKKLYALRDVTGTVDSLPLIAASIMSKKLIVKSDYIFLDVKVGEGAFLKTVEQAEAFSELALKIAHRFNRKTIIHLTSMSQPLGRAIGNAIEVQEALDFLQGNIWSSRLKELVFSLCSDILVDTKICFDHSQAIKKIEEVIKNKSAYNKFINFVTAFSKNSDVVKEEKFFHPQYKLDIYAEKEGYLLFKSSSKVGLIANFLGAGRFKKEDKIDFQAGIKLHFDVFEHVKASQLIATLYSNKPIDSKFAQEFNDNLIFADKTPESQKIIIKKIQ